MARFVDLSRYSSLVLVLLALGGLLAAADLATRAALGLAPHALSRTEYLNPRYLAEFGGRVTAVEQELEHLPLADRGLGVVLGLSTARVGILEAGLEQQVKPPLHWLNLGGSGGSFYELSYYARPLAWSHLRPKAVVIGAHPSWMAGRILAPRPLDASPRGLFRALRGHDLGGVSERLKRWSWFVFNRNRLALNLQRGLALARERLFQGLGFPLAALYQPSKDPWRVRREFEGHASEQERTTQMQFWNTFRWFDPARYTEDTVEREAFREFLQDCRRVSTRVVVVMMPEAAPMRARIPPIAKARFFDAVRGFDPSIEVVDLSNSLPETAFYDNTHVGAAGRALTTEMLSRYLAEGRGHATIGERP